MAFNYVQGSIAGVSLDFQGDHCKAMILDGASLRQRFHGTQKHAADGRVWTQLVDVGMSGAQFGVWFEFMPAAMLDSIVAAINDALGSNSPFRVDLQDDIHAVDEDVMPDFMAGKGQWLEYEKQRTTDFVSNVTFRFVVP